MRKRLGPGQIRERAARRLLMMRELAAYGKYLRHESDESELVAALDRSAVVMTRHIAEQFGVGLGLLVDIPKRPR